MTITTKVTVTHSHSHADDHDHEDDHHEATEHDQPDSHGPQDHHDESDAHSHTILIGSSPAAYTSPAYGEFVGLILSSTSFSVSRNATPPLDPGLGSIFRPPIA
ncbi:hypothetical protein [Bdellovibrio sp. GT3]|uniref:hypothetical protein n=1 Tax=Bdellovibrio sp. GT3 TaxID=3136282 RepID=UPI0030F0C8A4